MPQQRYLELARSWRVDKGREEQRFTDKTISTAAPACEREISEKSEISAWSSEAIAEAEAIIRSRPDTWRDPEPDICHTCGKAAIGYSREARKACQKHIDGGRRW